MTNRTERILEKLSEAFTPETLEVVDDSARHAGHAGAAPGGETHYNVTIVSQAFDGLSRVQIQRTIHMVLADEFESGLHALSLKASAPRPEA
ncbi:MAG: BolA family protein [Pseudomonadota bacterium]